MSPRNVAIAALSAATLAACTAPAFVSPVEVTRFSASEPASLGSGTIRIEAAPAIDPDAIEYALYEAELAEELAALGYQVVPANAGQVAVLDITASISQPDRRGPVSVGGGAGVGSYGSGVGLGIGLDLSPRPSEQIDRQVSVSIRPAAGGTNLWEGRARFTATANSEYADPAMAADRAIEALFTGFPGESGETIEID